MTTFDIPTSVAIVSSTFGLEYNSQSFQSPLNNAEQVLELAGSRWILNATLRVYKANTDASEEIKSFLTKLRGRTNDFNAYDPDYGGARGALGGTPLVAGGSQTGNTLNIDGASNNVTGWAKDGDYFEVNGEFKRCIADADSNGSGEVTLTFEPPLRNSPADNAAVNFTNPRCRMRLVGDDQALWQSGPAKNQAMTINGAERLDI